MALLYTTYANSKNPAVHRRAEEIKERLGFTKGVRTAPLYEMAKNAQAKLAGRRPTTATARMTDRQFADTVQAAIRRVGPEGRFGSNKVYIDRAFGAFRSHTGLNVNMAEFKARLATANNARAIDLSRADLVQAMPRRRIRRSEIEFHGASFHFIRVR